MHDQEDGSREAVHTVPLRFPSLFDGPGMADLQMQRGGGSCQFADQNVPFRHPGEQNVSSAAPLVIVGQVKSAVAAFRSVRIGDIVSCIQQKAASHVRPLSSDKECGHFFPFFRGIVVEQKEADRFQAADEKARDS